MPLSGATIENISQALKEFYLPAIREQLNNDTILLNRLKRDEVNVSGKYAVILLHTRRNQGIGARADGETLPEAGYQDYTRARVPMRYNYGRIEISGPTIKATQNDKGAWKRIINAEIEGMVRDLKKDINRQLWGCGYGILAKYKTNTGTTYTAVASYNGEATPGFGDTFGVKYIENGMQLDYHALAGGVSLTRDATFSCGASGISSVNSADNTFVVSAEAGAAEAVGDIFVRKDSGPSGTTTLSRKEMMGLRGIVTDTNIDDVLRDADGSGVTNPDPLQGIDVSGNDWWKANVVLAGDNASRYGTQQPLSLDDMQRAFDAAPQKLGVEYEPTLILMPFALRRKLVDLLVQDKRYVSMELDGGYKAIEFNGRPVVVDTDAVDGEIYFLYEPSLRIYRMSDFDWMDMDGSILSRVAGYDAYEAILFAYMELGVDNRQANTVLCDLQY